MGNLSSWWRITRQEALIAINWLERGIHFRQRHQWKRAIQCFLEATQSDPGDPQGWYYLAVTLDNRGQEAQAIPAYQRALELGLDPECERNAWAWMGSSLRKTRRPEDAMVCFDKAETLGYMGADLNGFRGLALLALKCFEDALLALDQALRLEPKNPAYWRCRFRALRRLKRQMEAEAALAEAKRLEDGNNA